MADTREPVKETTREPVRDTPKKDSNFGKAVILTRIKWGTCIRERGYGGIAYRSWSGIQKLYAV